MAEMIAFGEPEFFATSQIRDYCNNARQILRPMAYELEVASEELRASLRFVKTVDPKMLGLDRIVRAKLVADHLKNAGEALVVAQTSITKTYLSFRKHYVVELNKAGYTPPKGKEFDFKG